MDLIYRNATWLFLHKGTMSLQLKPSRWLPSVSLNVRPYQPAEMTLQAPRVLSRTAELHLTARLRLFGR